MSFKNVNELDSFLLNKSYVQGYSFSDADVKALSSLSGIPDKNSFPNANRWARHVIALAGINNISFSGSVSTSAPAAKPAGKAEAAKPAAKAKDEDFDDMFGDEEEEDANGETAADRARHERMEHARKLKEEADAKSGKAKKEKEKPVEKSLVVLEVKPWEADTNLEQVWHEIIKYQQEGLQWGESFKLEPIAYGIMKLVMTCTIVDSLVLMDDITDNIEALENWVQSVHVASMNKI
jgi:elongation factor 1-beta